MNDQETTELAELLEQVVSKITVQERQGTDRMGLNQYRAILVEADKAVDRYAYVVASRYELNVPVHLRESLHDRIRATLAQYIDGDSIQTANIVIGTRMHPGFPVNMVVDHLAPIHRKDERVGAVKG